MSPVGWGCITSLKYDQTATLLRQGYGSSVPIIGTDEVLHEDSETTGPYVTKQDPITGAIIRVWEPAIIVPDDPATPDINEEQVFNFECQARGIITGGLNSQGTAERWTSKGTYENVDFVEMQVAPSVIITKRDRVTNIRNSRGEIVWREEEYGSMKPTVFDVRGVMPSLDPFGSLVEWYVLLERTEDQGAPTSG